VLEKKSQSTALPVEAENGLSIKANQKIWNLRMALEEFEKQLIIKALKENLGHRGKTATILGIDRKTLYTKLKKTKSSKQTEVITYPFNCNETVCSKARSEAECRSTHY
jgi:DNA-binding NtrC family response regulator